MEATDPRLILAYEATIKKLEDRKVELTEKIQVSNQPLQTFDETFRTAIDFLGNPQKLWGSGQYADKRTVLKLAFSERLPYSRNEGFRTMNLTLPFKVLADLTQTNCGMVGAAGIEPATPAV